MVSVTHSGAFAIVVNMAFVKRRNWPLLLDADFLARLYAEAGIAPSSIFLDQRSAAGSDKLCDWRLSNNDYACRPTIFVK
jgi:hypothetical protein